jgi:hypothetical protein
VLASAEVDGYDLVLRAGLLQRRHAPRHVPRHRRAVQLHRSHAFSLSLYSPLSCARFRSDPVFSPVCLIGDGFGSDLTAGAAVENLRDGGFVVEWELVGGAGVVIPVGGAGVVIQWPARSRV